MYDGLLAGVAVARVTGTAKPLVGQIDRQQEFLPINILEPTLPLQQLAESAVWDLDRDSVESEPAGGPT